MEIQLFKNKNIIKISIGIVLFLCLRTNSLAATFEFSPPTDTFTTCQQTVDIIIDATGQNSNAADIEVNYDSNDVTIIDYDTGQANTQIIEASAYTKYWGNQTDTGTRRIYLAGGALPDPNITLTSREVFASIDFAFTGAGPQTINFTIRMDAIGNTVDSNIADTTTGNDLLTSVVHGSYTFDTGPNCIGYVPTTLTPPVATPTNTNGGSGGGGNNNPTPIQSPGLTPNVSEMISETINPPITDESSPLETSNQKIIDNNTKLDEEGNIVENNILINIAEELSSIFQNGNKTNDTNTENISNNTLLQKRVLLFNLIALCLFIFVFGPLLLLIGKLRFKVEIRHKGLSQKEIDEIKDKILDVIYLPKFNIVEEKDYKTNMNLTLYNLAPKRKQRKITKIEEEFDMKSIKELPENINKSNADLLVVIPK